jgi:uncharacterized RDD family membrane protein YckC
MKDLFEENEGPNLASTSVRLLASLIDYALYVGVFILIAENFGEKYTPDGGGVGYRVEGFPAFVCFILWFMLLPIPESITGQSIGKLICRIKVQRFDGSKANIGNTFSRHLFDVLDFLPFLGIVGLVVSSKSSLKQRVGDIVGKTIVVKKV